jgi:hypothetical protein
MTTDMVALDGNAAAGTVGRCFAFDITMAMVTCGACGNARPFAELRMYGRPQAVVLRCCGCGSVNIRVLETEKSIYLDMSGAARVEFAGGQPLLRGAA